MSFFSPKKILLLGFVVALLVAIPLTVFYLQTQQQTQGGAAKSTTLSFDPTSTQLNPIQKKVGEDIALNVMMNPGTNQVIATTLNIQYDPTKIATVEAEPTAAFSSIIEGPIYTPGNISITMSVGIDLTKVIKEITKVAKISFKAVAPTEPSNPTQVTFTGRTNVTSTVSSDPEDTNVLSTTIPAFIAIGAGDIVVIPTPTSTPPPPAGLPAPNTAPVCATLNIDREASGSAPFSVLFTVNGNDTDGTIKKATFNFGDGPVQDVTIGGGIGSSSVSVQIAHTYNNPGAFRASALLTDNLNGTSDPNVCQQTITVGTPIVTQTPIGAPVVPDITTAPTPAPTIAPPGPGDNIVKIGVLGAALSIIGGFLFLAL